MERLAEQGFVGIMLSQSPELVAPHGTSQAVFGTNPVAVGCPQAEGQPPLVVDLATSEVAMYDLVSAREAGRQVRVMIAPGCLQPRPAGRTRHMSGCAVGALAPWRACTPCIGTAAATTPCSWHPCAVRPCS